VNGQDGEVHVWYEAFPLGLDPLWNHISRTKIPKIIYHYTRPEGFAGIFKTKSLWASHTFHLNDRGESAYAQEVLDQAFEEFASGFLNQDSQGYELLQNAMRVYRVSIGGFRGDTYVASFSSHSDLLSQWERYASPHGYAIGIGVAESLVSETGPLLRLAPVEYRRDVQLRIFKEILAIAINALVRGGPEAGNPELLAKWASSYANVLQLVSRNFKDHAFKEESEWRIATTLRNVRAGDIEFRAGKFGVIPYTSIDFSDIADVVIKKIVISPSNYFAEAKSAVELVLLASGIDPHGVSIEASEIRLRV
jgi:hypothetical protein